MLEAGSPATVVDMYEPAKTHGRWIISTGGLHIPNHNVIRWQTAVLAYIEQPESGGLPDLNNREI